ncbi:glycine zipper 2TM domain-containing protein [Azospirillum sp. SYSU D00513]|uniref:glycine zipper 2TM domain-containing protein n=1 Tax=Azospirillum sp. SYSU D00513 TaxID=2812561 RepID=UPI001A96912C|nr:glycine zipper 2TM domain-containing protein [Azospirillum sp. SYSU D00513]
MSRMPLTAAFLAGTLSMVPVLSGTAWADPWKDESGHGRYRHGHHHEGEWRGDRDGGRRGDRAEWKEEYWDGNCKVERKWERDGDYKEERKCKGGRDDHRHREPVYVVPPPAPAPVYAVPAPQNSYDPSPGVFMGGMPMAVGPVPGMPGIACNRDLIGGLLGGAAGGVLGNQFGRGAGNAAATIGGAVIGAIVGGSIGRGMDQADQACVGQALEYGQPNQPIAWRNPEGGWYQVTPTRGFERHGNPCREYVTEASIDGRGRQQVTGMACREPDGTWRILR